MDATTQAYQPRLSRAYCYKGLEFRDLGLFDKANPSYDRAHVVEPIDTYAIQESALANRVDRWLEYEAMHNHS